MSDTRYQLNKGRPIVGCKIVGQHTKKSISEEMKSDTKTDSNIEMYYNLFPSNKNGFELNPLKYISEPSKPYTHTSPVASAHVSSLSIYNSRKLLPPNINRTQNTGNLSPEMTDKGQYRDNYSHTPLNWIIYPDNLSLFSHSIPYPLSNPYIPSYFKPSARYGMMDPSKKCMFCRKNGERPAVYIGHNVKEKIGNSYIVTCPILRIFECMICGAIGDNAHTISYCPVLRSFNNGRRLNSYAVALNSTQHKSNGQKR